MPDYSRSPIFDKPNPSFIQGQIWFIAKNVIGWLLMLSAPVIGIAIPGPGGIPIFLVGFALATIPGKRKMTSHVMRGRPVRVNERMFAGIITFCAVAASTAIIWYFAAKRETIIEALNITDDETGRFVAIIIGLCVFAIAISWIAIRLGVWGMNILFRTLPKARRLIRPWLKKYGVALLPPRRKLVDETGAHVNENEILHFGEDSHRRFRNAGKWLLQWGRRALTLGITLYIFFWILRPVFAKWTLTKDRLGQIGWFDLSVSVLMFALFLALIRGATWRSILRGFGYPVPRLAALRIWITSELARYLPGAIWQVISRVRLIKPYGVRGSVTSTSQVLELAVFLLANVCVAVSCLCFLGFKHIHGPARSWFFIAMCMVPLLSLILHPKVFYGLTDRILARLKKPPIANRLTMRHLMRLFAMAVFGLLWQSAALWVLLHGPLEIGWRDWWIVAGAYCLAWTAGFLAVWAPGGLGVRELVFIGALAVALPPAVRERINVGDPNDPTLEALAVLTRLWTIVAEILVAAVAFPLDWRGAIGDPDAPGRLQIQTLPITADTDESERETPLENRTDAATQQTEDTRPS